MLFNSQNQFSQKINNNYDVFSESKELHPVWIDEDDDVLESSKISNVKNKDFYNNALKQKFVNLMGTPNWARLDKKTKINEDDEILRKVGHIQQVHTAGLSSDTLEIKRFPKINADTGNEGPIITSVQFHPISSVALVGGLSGRVSLFSIGGDKNNKLHSFNLKKSSILSTHFTPDGEEAYISFKEDHKYCVYNLMKAEHNLIQLPKIIKKPFIFELSKNGKYIAVADGFDEVAIISAVSKELLRTLKHNFNVVSMCFNFESDKLYCLGVSGEVSIWNMSSYRIEKKFYDEGCVNGSCIANSSCGKFVAVGSNEGIVNIYENDSIKTAQPKPEKTINNLRTKITNMTFNSSTEILAISSSYYPNAIKLLHLPTFHVFSNFPSPGTNFHHVGPVCFSPNSGYLALGNNKSCANLFRLRYFKNY